jgi:hypothetical protein
MMALPLATLTIQREKERHLRIDLWEMRGSMVALFFLYYSFCRVHPTLRVTPAMEAGISDHVWSIEELCSLLPETASATKRIDKRLILEALGERAS